MIGRAIEDWRYLLEQQGPVDLDQFYRSRFSAIGKRCAICVVRYPTILASGGLLIEIDSSEVIDHLIRDRCRREVRLHNVAIVVDNVGTEWPSLMGLRSFPFVELKVDHQFVTGCADDRLKQSVCRRIVELAQDNGARAVAQGTAFAPTFSPRMASVSI